MEVIVKEVSKPRLTLSFCGRVTLKVPPGLEAVERYRAFATYVAERVGKPSQTLRGQIKLNPWGLLSASLRSCGKHLHSVSVVEPL